jgi:hypothetical protein
MNRLPYNERLCKDPHRQGLYEKFGPFVGVPNFFIEEARGLFVHARWLWVCLRFYAGLKNTAYPSYDALEELTGFRRAMISQSLRELEGSGWISRQRRFGQSTIYTLHHSPRIQPPGRGHQGKRRKSAILSDEEVEAGYSSVNF